MTTTSTTPGWSERNAAAMADVHHQEQEEDDFNMALASQNSLDEEQPQAEEEEEREQLAASSKKKKRKAGNRAEDEEIQVSSPAKLLRRSQEEVDQDELRQPASRVKKSLEMSLSKLKKEQKRNWIEPLEDRSGYRILLGSKENSPIVTSLDDARLIVSWFQDKEYVGVKRRKGGGYACYVIMNRGIHFLDQLYETAVDAAQAHDEHVDLNKLGYIKNFRVLKKDKEQMEIRKHNRSADMRYLVKNTRVHFLRNNVRATKALAIRLAATPTTPTLEVWRVLENLLRMCTQWAMWTDVISMRSIRDFSEALRVSWRLGDRQLLLEENAARKKSLTGEQKDKLQRTLDRERLKWTEGCFDMYRDMYIELRRRRYSRLAIRVLHWGSELLRTKAIILQESETQREKMAAFMALLEDLENDPVWSQHSDFLQLRGELIMAQSTEEPNETKKLRAAQRCFAKAVLADPTNARAKTFLASSEHFVTDAEQRQLNTTMMSVSQRTTQENGDDEDDEDEEATDVAVPPAETEETVVKMVNAMIRQNRRDVSAWLAMENLLFVDDDDDDTKEIRENKRQCLLALLDLCPFLTEGALERVKLLWRLSRKSRIEKRVEFFWMLACVMESLTQRECPNYTLYYSDQSLPLWEHMVTCLNSIPTDTIRFEPDRAELWRRRFFPDVIGHTHDPLGFFLEDRLELARKKVRVLSWKESRPIHYMWALQAVVASMTDLSPSFHTEVVHKLGEGFVNNVAVNKAIKACASPKLNKVTAEEVKSESDEAEGDDDAEEVEQDADD